MTKFLKKSTRIIECANHIDKFYNYHCHFIPLWIILCLSLTIASCAPILTPDTHSTVPSQANLMIPSNIESMIFQNESILWIGNRDGVGRLNLVENRLQIFTGIKCTHIIITNNYEHVWCSGAGDVYKYNGMSWDRFEISAYQIVESDDGTLWAGTQQGMSRFNNKEREWSPILSTSQVAPHFTFSTGPGIHLEFIGNDGAFWFYSFSEPYVGTTRWTQGSYQTWHPAGEWIVVQPKLEAQDSTVWGIGDDSIVAQWDGQSWQIWQPFRLKPAIRDLIQAQDKSIWVLAVADGIGQWNGLTWKVWT